VKSNNSGISQSLKLRIFVGKILPISPKLNFTSNTSGCYGLTLVLFVPKYVWNQCLKFYRLLGEAGFVKININGSLLLLTHRKMVSEKGRICCIHCRFLFQRYRTIGRQTAGDAASRPRRPECALRVSAGRSEVDGAQLVRIPRKSWRLRF